jgi:hypothetical protein
MSQYVPSLTHPSAATTNGNITITGTTLKRGKWGAIQILADAVFSTLTDDENDSNGDSNTSGITYPAGTVIYGHFTEIKLTSGKVRAYALKAV